MFGVNHFNLHLSLTTIIFNVAHVGKEAFGPQDAHSCFQMFLLLYLPGVYAR